MIFSAGSFSVDIQHELQGHSRNQFYLIDLPLNEIAKGRFVGRIEAWDWTNGRGWIPAGPSSGLPSSAGFGCRTDPNVLASQVAHAVGSRG